MLTVLIISSAACSNSVKDKAEANKRQREAIKLKNDNAAQKLSQKYNAISGWKKNIDSLDAPYSLRLSRLLVNKQPMLFEASLVDIRETDGKFILTADEYMPNGEARLCLVCPPKIVENLLSRKLPHSPYVSLAIVATIKEVQKADFRINSVVEEDGEPSRIEIDTSDLFIIKGDCIDCVVME